MKKSAMSMFVFCLTTLFTGLAFGANHADRVKGPFTSGPEVTKACLTCHEKQAKDFMKTVHWTWETTQEVPGKGKAAIGKKGSINNFCISIASNWPRCTSCHAGYGWKDATFSFSDPATVDCLVCHDTTGTYKKEQKSAGNPDPTVDLLKVAQSVGKPGRVNCGACHFFGGGGDHIKHGDLDSSMTNPKRAYDVHMGTDGANLACQGCHQTQNHDIPGQAMSVSVGDGQRVECGGCHGAAPHKNDRLNKHTKTVACQTCHIPTFAKDEATKMWWDWSKAGDKERKPKEDENDMEDYAAIKGEFKWAKNVVPTYAWYNGKSERYLFGEKVDPAKIVYLTKPIGSIKDKNARIYPFKLMGGKQPYDSKNNYLVTPNTFGGYWKHMDWQKAITDGMSASGLPYSGSYGFVETKMFWRINHMVVPKEQALKCTDCHSKNGRLNWKELGYKGDPQKVGAGKIK
jgi:octaheme c-type cytochrome (tetrathionate reductase family)